MICAYTGDDTGLLKKVRLGPSAPETLQRWGTQEAGGGVSCCSWGPPSTAEAFVGVGLDSGVVRFWRASETASATAPYFDAAPASSENADGAAEAGSGTSVGIAALHTFGTEASSSRVLSCDRRGCVRVYSWERAAGSKGGALSPATPLTSFEAGDAKDAKGASGDYKSYVATVEASGGLVALGGRDKDLVVWDVGQSTACFRARNVPHDNLDLAVPVWVSGLQFDPTAEGRVVAMCTGYVESRLRGEVRLYDIRSGQRRPTQRAIAPMMGGGLSAAAATGCEEAMRSVCITPDGRYAIVGSNGGQMARLDMRMGLKRLSGYKGAAGSIRQITVHPTLPLVVAASLDRHVRCYDLEGKGEPVKKVYLKQRLSALLLSSETPKVGPKGAGGAQATGRSGGAGGADASSDDGDDGDDVAAMLGALPEVGEEGRGGAAAGAGGGGSAKGRKEGGGGGDGGLGGGLDGAAGFAVDASFGNGGGDDDDDDDDDDDGMGELDGAGRGGGGGRDESDEEEEDMPVDEEDEADGEGVVAAMLRAKKGGGAKGSGAKGSGAKGGAKGSGAKRKEQPAADAEEEAAPAEEGKKGKKKKKKKTKMVEIS